MIEFQGVRPNGKKGHVLCFSNGNSKIEIPIDSATAHRISLYLDRLSPNQQIELSNEQEE